MLDSPAVPLGGVEMRFVGARSSACTALAAAVLAIAGFGSSSRTTARSGSGGADDQARRHA